MIGALLMTLCLAIVFLTRPNRKRDEHFRKCALKIRGLLNKNLLSRNKELSQSTVAMKSESDYIRTSSRSEVIMKYSLLEETTIQYFCKITNPKYTPKLSK